MGLGSGLDIGSPAGYLNSQVYANMLPLLFLIFLIGFAVKETAGEERDHTLDLLLAHPVTRARALLEKTAALLGSGLMLGLVSAITLIVFGPLVDLDLSLGAYVGATLSSVAVAWVFAAVALAMGAWTGSRAVSIGVASGLAVVLYIFWGLAPLVDALEMTNPINPWYWSLAGDPVVNGIQLANLGLLVAMTAGFTALAVVGFRRRDLGV
jgi:ABC-2 type transport system permease protein